MTTDKAIELLRSCETELRTLLAQAAAAGDYDALLTITEWARQIARMYESRTGAGPAPESTVEAQGSLADARVQRDGKRPRRRGKRRSTPSGYPRFLKRKNELVKIGWSRREKREYQHKAPREYLDLLVKRLVQVGVGGRLFSSDDLFPLDDASGTGEVPSYQVYLCLAWLRQTGLVEPKGRQGYTVADAATLAESVEGLWTALPRK